VPGSSRTSTGSTAGVLDRFMTDTPRLFSTPAARKPKNSNLKPGGLPSWELRQSDTLARPEGDHR
jgi:hypothetical protein